MNTSFLPGPAALVPPAASAPGAGGDMFPAITLQAALVGVESARLALRCGQGRLMEWILDGDLEWAFDLRRPGSRRAYLRILTASVVRLQQRNRPLTPREKAAQQWHPFQPLYDAMFPPHKPVLLSTGLARVWNCGTTHVHNLVDDGLLTLVKQDHASREALQISRQSAFHFMQSRRIK